jgi:hypothetical protein
MQTKKILKYKILLCLLAICLTKAYSQEDSLLYDKNFLDNISLADLLGISKPKSHFKIQTSYLSNYVYAGRKETVAVPYLTSMLEFNHKSGVYASASTSFLSNNHHKLDVWSLSGGYSFDKSHHFGGSVYINKIFYADSSKNVQSDINFSMGGSLTYDTKYLNFVASPSFMFGTKIDFALAISLDHSFDLANDTSNYLFSITPSFATYFGSSGYYQSYKKNSNNRNRRDNLQQITITSSAPNTFQLMSYEFSLPLNYDRLKWGLFFSPTYVIATNPIITTNTASSRNGRNIPLPITVSGETISSKETEPISNSFFVELGFYYKF